MKISPGTSLHLKTLHDISEAQAMGLTEILDYFRTAMSLEDQLTG